MCFRVLYVVASKALCPHGDTGGGVPNSVMCVLCVTGTGLLGKASPNQQIRRMVMT